MSYPIIESKDKIVSKTVLNNLPFKTLKVSTLSSENNAKTDYYLVDTDGKDGGLVLNFQFYGGIEQDTAFKIISSLGFIN